MATKVKTKEGKGNGDFHLFAVKWLQKLIDFLKRIMTANLLNFSIKWLTKIGHFALLVAAALGFICIIIATIRENKFDLFLYAIAWVIAVFVVQYTAHRFSPAGETLIANNPTRLSSKAFLDCFGFLALLLGVVLLIMGTVTAIRGGENIFNLFYILTDIRVKGVEAFLAGLGGLVFCWFMALIAFNSETVSMEIVKETSAGQEAIGIGTFFIKSLLKLVPIAFGVGIIVFTITMFIHAFKLFGTNWSIAFVDDAISILIFGLLFFISYLLFVLFFLIVDLIRSILAIPGKLGK